MDKAITAGKVKAPTGKSTDNAVSVYVNALFKTAKITKDNEASPKTFQLNNTGAVKNTEEPEKINFGPPEINTLDEAILEVMRRKPAVNYSVSTLSNNIRLSEEFVQIAANLNGTLMNCIEDSVKKMTRDNILIKNGSDEYKINPKAE